MVRLRNLSLAAHLYGMLLAAILAGLLLRCFHVQSHELQYDEAATGYFAGLPWADLWGGPAQLEPNPPLFYSLAWLITHAGGSVEQIRYISVIAGGLCIPLAWLIARWLAGDFAAASAALLVAASPQHIAISQYARAYAQLILCLMCAFFCLTRARHLAFARPPAWPGRLPWWLGYAAAGTAALYTHHTAAVVLAALNLTALLSSIRAGSAGWRFSMELLAANLPIAALYAPWLPVIASQALPAGVPSATKLVPAASILHRLWNGAFSPFPFRGLPWIDNWVLPFIALAAWRFRSSKDMAFLVAFVLAGLVLMFLASQFHPLLDGKTLAWAGLFSVAAAGIGCGAFGPFRWPVLALLVLLQLRSAPAALDPPPEGWREAAGILRETARPHDAIYTNYAAAVLPLRHYGWRENDVTLKVFAKGNEEPWFRDWTGQIVPAQEIARQAMQSSRAWLLMYGETPQSAGIEKEIDAKSIRKLHWSTSKLDLYLFEFDPAETSPRESP